MQDPLRGGRDDLLEDIIAFIQAGDAGALPNDENATPRRRLVPEFMLKLAHKVSPFWACWATFWNLNIIWAQTQGLLLLGFVHSLIDCYNGGRTTVDFLDEQKTMTSKLNCATTYSFKKIVIVLPTCTLFPTVATLDLNKGYPAHKVWIWGQFLS